MGNTEFGYMGKLPNQAGSNSGVFSITEQQYLADRDQWALQQPADIPVTSSLSLYYDASHTDSYSGSGTAIYDLSGNGRNATIVGSNISFSSVAGFQSYWSFNANDNGMYMQTSSSANHQSFFAVVNPAEVNQGLLGLFANGTPSSGNDKSFRFTQDGNYSAIARYSGDGNDWGGTGGSTIYNNGNSYNSNRTLSTGWNSLGQNRNNSNFGTFTMYIGSSAYSGRSYRGGLALIAAWTRALSASEYSTLHNWAANRFTF